MRVFFGNELETLAEEWERDLFSDPDPFKRRVVLVHGPAMKDWLVQQVLSREPGRCLLGVEWVYYPQFLSNMLSLFSQGEKEVFPNRHDWGWAIEAVEGPEQAKELGAAFADYARYGGKEWEESRHPQKAIWNRVRERFPHWKTPWEERKSFDTPPTGKTFSLHVFSLPFLDPLERDLLRRVAQHSSVSVYLFSPCAHFWTDLRSDRESAYLQGALQKEGVSEGVLQDWEALVWDRNALLANLGRVGQMMSQAMHELAPHGEQEYVLNGDLYRDEAYVPWIFEEIRERRGKSLLLHRVQADLLLMRTVEGEAIEREEVPSIQFHTATSRKREVEAAYQQILHLLAKKEALEPVDIVVMAPDIAHYQPWIEAVFREVPVQVIDVKLPLGNPLLHGFSLLLALAKSRWDRETVFAVWQHPSFQEMHGLDQDRLNKLRRWVEHAGIVWGVHAGHRREILSRDHCLEVREEDEGGTWRSGIGELLRSLAVVDPFDGVEPVSYSDAPLLGECAQWVESMVSNLEPIVDGSTRTLKAWEELFLGWIRTYFGDAGDAWQEVVHFFSFLSAGGIEEPFSFESLEEDLSDRLNSASVSYRNTQQQAVSCCSLLPMRTIPAKVVVLLGMEEEAFPRKNPPVPAFHLFPPGKRSGRPLLSDWDRYLFLEAVVSCRETLVISWRRCDEADNKPLEPSSVVEELRRYLEKGYGELCTTVHPVDAFDSAYFSRGLLISYSQDDFATCLALREQERREASSFFFSINQRKEATMILDVSHWTRLAKHPIRYFFQERLGIMFPSKKDRKESEPLLLEPLDRHALRLASLQMSASALHSIARKRGMLSAGVFERVSWGRFEKETEEIHAFFLAERPFSLVFQVGIDSPRRLASGDWLLPAPLVVDSEGKRVALVGRVEGISKRGKVMMGRKDLAKACQVWPEWLLLQAARERLPEYLEGALLFPLEGKVVSPPPVSGMDDLQTFFSYWEQAQRQPSPVLPRWVQTFVEKEERDIVDTIEKTMTDPFSYGVDEYIQSAFSEQVPFEVVSMWRETAKGVYGPLVTHWKEAR